MPCVLFPTAWGWQVSSKAETQTCISDFVSVLSSASCGLSRGVLAVALGPGQARVAGVCPCGDVGAERVQGLVLLRSSCCLTSASLTSLTRKTEVVTSVGKCCREDEVKHRELLAT